MTEPLEISLKIAQGQDASQLKTFLKQVSQETDFLALDRVGLNLPDDLLAGQLASISESDNNLLLLAQTATGEIVGIASVLADYDPALEHIGEIGIAVSKKYWHAGIGSLLLDEVLYWGKTSGIIRRLQLTVQVRNQAAVALYQKFDFQIEATLARGAKDMAGNFLEVYLMSLLID